MRSAKVSAAVLVIPFLILFLLAAPAHLSAGEIHDAAAAGDVATLASILGRNPAAAREMDDEGIPPLCHAARAGQLDAARLILGSGASVCLGDPDCTQPIHYAALGGQPEMIDLLLSRKAMIDAQDQNRMTPLLFALSSRHIETAAHLVELGASPSLANGRGVTPLHYAAIRGAHDLARELIACGADVNAETADLSTPLHLAAVWADDIDMARLLLESGADTERQDDYGRTPLCLTARETGNAHMGRLLIEHGAEIGAADRYDATPLSLAAWRGFGMFVSLLLDHGVPVPLQGTQSEEITRYAAKRGLDRLFAALADGGADLTIRDEFGGSLLHSAAQGGSVEIARALADRGLRIDERDTYGWTPLHHAAQKGRLDVARWLLDQGADRDARSLSGAAALHVAEENGQDEIARLLREHPADTSPQQFPALAGLYFGQPAPTDQPAPFALDIVSTNRFEHGSIAFSPDGAEAFWSSSFEADSGYSYSRILTSRVANGRWTKPDLAPFSTEPRTGDDVPFFHPDGSKLFIDSGRPDEPGGEPGAERIWMMERRDGGWSEPRVIEGGPNDQSIHWQFSVAANGNIYFSSGGDLWVSRPLSGLRYAAAEKLPPVINGDETLEGSPFIAPDESYLLFVGNRRPDALGGSDLYISFRDRSGGWSAPIHLEEPINSPANDHCPAVSPDGRHLFFNSHRSGTADIYWVDAGFIDELRRPTM